MEPSASVGAVEINFSLQIGKGLLHASADVPTGDVPLIKLLPVLQQLSSNIVGATQETIHEEGYQISCRAGCAACCRQLVPLSLFEAEFLAAWVRSLPVEQQNLLEARFSVAISGLKDKGILDRLAFAKMPPQGSPEELQLASDYIQAGVACPFLQQECCSIYAIRPLICREYLVTSPPQFCVSPTKKTVRPVPMPVKLSRALVTMGEQISTEKQGWIPLVFLFGWIKSGATVGQAYEMPGPELLRLVVEQLVTQQAEVTPQP